MRSLFIALFLGAAAASAQTEVHSTADVETGTLLYRGDNAYFASRAVRTQATIQVTGMIARTEVVQEFANTTGATLEGVYVFPLPPGAAVDRLRLQIGDRAIEGEIHEKAAAIKAYEQAKAEGKKASLLSQERPNVFSSAVANIGPNERVIVRIEYQETVHYEAGKFSLRFPLNINPGHFQPGENHVSGYGASGFTQYTPSRPLPASTMAPDRARIDVELDAGFEPADIVSDSHDITVQVAGEHRAIRLVGGPVAVDRDFVLSWRPASHKAPRAALFSEAFKGEGYALVMLTPPSVAGSSALPRDTVFIIDTSGSMSGESMEQAKRAVDLAIQRLRPTDRFEVISFSDDAHPLFGKSVEASLENVARARAFVSRMRSDGGTNMMSALRLALSGAPSQEALRQVVFITDGAVGNEAELFHFIQARLGGSRLFTVGIGAAPNGWFMREAAQFGRGTSTFIGRVNEVEEKMGAMFAKIEAPVISQIKLSAGVGAEIWPDRVPDLYLGEPIVATIRLAKDAPKTIVVSGVTGGEPFSVELPVVGGAEERGIHKLWAREKIEALADRVVMGTPEEEVRPAITKVALEHHLVSKYTSLVAIDRTPMVEVAAEAPVVPEAPIAFAQAMPSTATPAELCLLMALALGFVGFALMRKEPRS